MSDITERSDPSENPIRGALRDFTEGMLGDCEALNAKALQAYSDAMMEKVVKPLIAERDALVADNSLLRDALTDAIEERGMADAEAARLREERDALRARCEAGPSAMVGGLVYTLRDWADEIRENAPISSDELTQAADLIEHAYLPPVTSSPDPKDGE